MDTEDADACCKVGRAIQEYDLFDFNKEIRRKRENGASLRDLETFVNVRILERTLEQSAIDVIGDTESIYEALTSNDVRASRRTEVESTLRQHDIDVETVKKDFVSHQTVRDHLLGCLNIDTSRHAQIDFERERGTIEWAQRRCEKVIDRSLDRLQQADELHTGDIRLTHSLRVTCSGCGQTYRLNKLLDNGSCECQKDDKD